MGNKFPKLCRLRKSWEYQRAWQMGCKLHTPHFILLLAENSYQQSRLGLTVSRKIGNAVQRNRVKRRIREFFRQYKQHLSGHIDLSVVAKKGAAELSVQETIAEIKRALEFRGKANG